MKKKMVMHRDLKLPNIMLNFKNLRSDICTESKYDMKEFRKNFNFELDYKNL